MQWHPWSSPPLGSQLIYRLHLFLDGLKCHGHIDLKKFTLMLPVQIYLSHYNPRGLIHLLVVSVFLSGTTLGYVSIYVSLQPCSLHFCKLAQFTLSFSSFCNPSYRTPYNSLLLPTLSHIIPDILKKTILSRMKLRHPYLTITLHSDI